MRDTSRRDGRKPMSSTEITWKHIAHLDPYLAGNIAARGWEWWFESTAEQQADSVSLTGEQRSKFLAGWQYELSERERERKEQFVTAYDAMAAGWEKGDPAARK